MVISPSKKGKVRRGKRSTFNPQDVLLISASVNSDIDPGSGSDTVGTVKKSKRSNSFALKKEKGDRMTLVKARSDRNSLMRDMSNNSITSINESKEDGSELNEGGGGSDVDGKGEGGDVSTDMDQGSIARKGAKKEGGHSEKRRGSRQRRGSVMRRGSVSTSGDEGSSPAVRRGNTEVRRGSLLSSTGGNEVHSPAMSEKSLKGIMAIGGMSMDPKEGSPKMLADFDSSNEKTGVKTQRRSFVFSSFERKELIDTDEIDEMAKSKPLSNIQSCNLIMFIHVCLDV